MLSEDTRYVPENQPISISFKSEKCEPQNLMPLLFRNYPLVISPQAETPYGYCSYDRTSLIAIGANSPHPMKASYPRDFDTNPLSHPELARLFAQAKGWHYFPAPREITHHAQEYKSASFERKFSFPLFNSILNASLNNFHEHQNDVYMETKRQQVADWNTLAPYLEEVTLTWGDGIMSGDPTITGEFKPTGLALSTRVPHGNEEYSLSFKLDSGMDRSYNEIGSYSKALSIRIPMDMVLEGLQNDHLRDIAYAVQPRALEVATAYLKQQKNEPALSYVNKKNHFRIDDLVVTRNCRKISPTGSSCSSDYTIAEMWGDAIFALDVAYTALRQEISSEIDVLNSAKTGRVSSLTRSLTQQAAS